MQDLQHLLTRELIYTGLTGARHTGSIWAPEPVLKAAVARKIERTSGLRDAMHYERSWIQGSKVQSCKKGIINRWQKEKILRP